MKIRKSEERGSHSESWLEAKHSFSFAGYQDSQWVNFGSLRVLNEDRIAPGSGFPMHAHNDMEIITIMLSGEIRHRDSMGNEGSIYSGEVQAMTAGTGIRHSEWNPSKETTHLFQMWLFPDKDGLTPQYDQFKPEDNKIQVLASNHGEGLHINTNAEILRLKLEAGDSYTTAKDKKVYIHIVKGSLTAQKENLNAGDAVALDQEETTVTASNQAEIIVVKMKS